MATQLKTQRNKLSVRAFLDAVADEKRRRDALAVSQIMENITGEKPAMWGASMVGFGSYHYKYASGQEGDWPLVGFSPRKAAISLYVYTGAKEHEHLLEGLGKFKMGKGCIYAKKLADIDREVLKKLMKATIDFLQAKYK